MAVLRGEDRLVAEVVASGTRGSTVAELQEALIRTDAVGPLIGGEHRWLSFRLDEAGETKTVRPAPARRFRAQLYDYANERTLLLEGDVRRPEGVSVRDTARQPLPSEDELRAAVEVLRRDPRTGPALEAGEETTYRPMPPLAGRRLPDGRVERALMLGLHSPGRPKPHRLVAVGMARAEVLDEVERPVPANDTCGPPWGEDCAPGAETGEVRITVRQGRRTIWRLNVVRPAASSGTNGSGIELRRVDYRGTRVLYRAHVPILNVEYPGAPPGCGPTYRDWQNSEACFQAVGTDVIPGFRLCSEPPRTLLDSGIDGGPFRGVAIYFDGLELKLVSELQAGWYRYISVWGLHLDGTIRPRFGFAAVNNPCTCEAHHHHAYWRLDFDIDTAGNNVVEEFNDPPLGASNLHTKRYELRRPRDPARQRHWRVKNAQKGAGYRLVPGADDGTADAYGVGDVWILRYRGSELDDGQGFTTDPALSRAGLDAFLTGELIEGEDVVVWYAGHFLHDAAHAGGHIVGPDLTPFDWA